MDLGKVEEFVAFTRSMNFTTAARELHLSQPSLSKHVQDVEGELGVTLVRRGAAGAPNMLTPAGSRFLELAERLLADYRSLVAEVRELDAALPPARIQDVHHGFNITAQLHVLLREKGLHSGNFSYVRSDLPIRRALDEGVFDFAVHLEPTPEMTAFAAPELRDAYGWVPLAPERICFLAARGNPLFGAGEVCAADIVGQDVVSAASPSYASWFSALPSVFARHGVALRLKALPDTPLEGGAFPLGPHRLALATERFAFYYGDLGAETVCTLRLREFSPAVWPFAVFRRDCASPMARKVIDLLG